MEFLPLFESYEVGYHCSKNNIQPNKFDGEFTGNYIARFYRYIHEDMHRYDKKAYDKLMGLVKEHNDFFESEEEYDKIIDLNFINYEMQGYDGYEFICDELAKMVNEIGYRIIFVFGSSPSKAYGDMCYKVTFKNNKYIELYDDVDYGANVYVYNKNHNSVILDRMINESSDINTRLKFRIDGYTDSIRTCDRCGRSDLKGTYHITTEDGEEYNLGSSCIKKGWQMTQREFTNKLESDKKEIIAKATAEWQATAEHDKLVKYIGSVEHKNDIETGGYNLVSKTTRPLENKKAEIAGKYRLKPSDIRNKPKNNLLRY